MEYIFGPMKTTLIGWIYESCRLSDLYHNEAENTRLLNNMGVAIEH